MKTQKIQSIYHLRKLIDMLINRIFTLLIISFSFPLLVNLYWKIYCSLCQLPYDKNIFSPDAFSKLYFFLILCLGIVIVLKLLCYTILSFYGRKIYESNNTASKDMQLIALGNLKEEASFSSRITVIHILKVAKIITLCFQWFFIFLSMLPYIKRIIAEAKMHETITSSHIFSIIILLLIAGSIPAIAGGILLYLIKHDLQHLLDTHISQHSSYNSLTGVNFDEMNGIQFEQYCMTLFTCLGYKYMSYTKASQDQGVDLIGFKDGCKYAIQCKRYSYAVGNKAIQEVVAGMNMYSCQKALVITTNYFTRQARQLALVNNVELIDRTKLLQLLRSASISKTANQS